jgi:hypothetical protein
MIEPENESITPNDALKSDDALKPYTRTRDPKGPVYTGTGRTLPYALAKAVDDAIGQGGRAQTDQRPVRKQGDILEVIRWEVRLGNGHVPDHIIYLS